MLFLSLALFGLIRSKHLYNLLKFALYYFYFFYTGAEPIRMRYYAALSLLHNDKVYYILKQVVLSRVFLFF